MLATQPLRLILPEIILNLLMAVLFGVAAAGLYKRTHRGVSYSQSFVTSLALITVITSMIIMVIGNSLTMAFGLIGAFTLIRFRTAVKDARDVSFVFLSLVLGLAAGSGAYQIAILGFLTVMFLVFVLDRLKFGQADTYEYVLSFRSGVDKFGEGKYKDVFTRYLKESLILNVRTLEDARTLEMSFNIRPYRDSEINEFIQQLSGLESVSRVELMSTANDVEY